MLSIIIPTYNRHSSTNRAIYSILEQDVDVEIIVIDDASDRAYEIPTNHRNNKQIILSRLETNKGPAAARNFGIKIASKPLISFLDSDDYLLPDTLNKRIEFAIKNGILTPEGKKLIIGCSWHEKDNDNQIINTRNPKSSATQDDLFSGCWFCPGSAIIMNKDYLSDKSNSYDENLKRLEDLDLFMRLALSGSNYIAHHLIGTSIATSDSRNPDIVIKACNDIRDKYLNSQSLLSLKRQSYLKSYLFYELSRAYISKHEYHKALDHLLKSFIKKPRLTLYPGPGWASKQN